MVHNSLAYGDGLAERKKARREASLRARACHRRPCPVTLTGDGMHDVVAGHVACDATQGGSLQRSQLDKSTEIVLSTPIGLALRVLVDTSIPPLLRLPVRSPPPFQPMVPPPTPPS